MAFRVSFANGSSHGGRSGDDDLYSGFDSYSGFGEAPGPEAKRSSLTRTGTRFGAGSLPTNYQRTGLQTRSGARMGTAAGGTGASGNSLRAVTSVQAAGFTVGSVRSPGGIGGAGGRRGSTTVFGSSNRVGPAPALESKIEEGAEEKFKALERKIFAILEESCFALKRGDKNAALSKAKEAAKRERELVRERERAGNASGGGPGSGLESVNLDLTYSVLFALAGAYAANEMYSEASNTYSLLVRNKLFAHAGRLRLNMGNLLFAQRQYEKAARQYRMALDQVPATHQLIRCKILSNMGVALVRQGAYEDAFPAFQQCLELGAAASLAAGAASDAGGAFQAGLNLLLCQFALGDREKMKRVFQKMLQLDLRLEDEDRYAVRAADATDADPGARQLLEAISNDELRSLEKRRRAHAHACIKRAAQIIAPEIGVTMPPSMFGGGRGAGAEVGGMSAQAAFSAGYDWCLEQVRTSIYSELAHELEIDKALLYLKQRDINQAISSLKNFEKKDTRVASTAAVNLSALYLLENEQQQAERYADLANKADRYNPAALVAMGNCALAKAQLERARDHYRDALDKDPACTQAQYNLGLCLKRLQQSEAALEVFHKLHGLLKSDPQVLFLIASLYEQTGQRAAAIEWYLKLVGLVPTDASVLQRLAELHAAEGDEAAAAQYFSDAHRYYPSAMDVVSWLGAHYLKAQFYEKAILFFERASILQPASSKWPLMVAACYRRSGNFQRALDTYKAVHRRFPDDVECLTQLVRLCTDLGYSKESGDYTQQLRRAEKQHALKEQARAGSGSAGLRQGSASSRDSGSGAPTGAVSSQPAAPLPDRRKVVYDESDPYKQQGAALRANPMDVSYSDPLGPMAERPRTSAAPRGAQRSHVDDLDEPLDELLPQ